MFLPALNLFTLDARSNIDTVLTKHGVLLNTDSIVKRSFKNPSESDGFWVMWH